jgi:hypothetical protein
MAKPISKTRSRPGPKHVLVVAKGRVNRHPPLRVASIYAGASGSRPSCRSRLPGAFAFNPGSALGPRRSRPRRSSRRGS